MDEKKNIGQLIKQWLEKCINKWVELWMGRSNGCLDGKQIYGPMN